MKLKLVKRKTRNLRPETQEENDNKTENSKAIRDAEEQDDTIVKYFDNSKAYVSLPRPGALP